MTFASSHDSAPATVYSPSARDRSDQTVVVVVIVLVVVVVGGFLGALVAFSIHYTNKYAAIDKSQDSLSWVPDQRDALSTTFSNPAAGVTLKLPGRWVQSKNPTKYLCHLVGPAGINAVLELDYPAMAPLVTTDAAAVAARCQSRNHWTLGDQQSIDVSGFSARLLHMSTPDNLNVDILLVKKWPAVYGLSIAGRSTAKDDWKRVEDALPDALVIR